MIISTIGPIFVRDKNLTSCVAHLEACQYGEKVWWHGLIVDMILDENHLNHIIITIDLEALKFNGFLSYIFYEFKINKYNLD